jgi:hypothetical protein
MAVAGSLPKWAPFSMRLLLTAAALSAWYWGLLHWPRLPNPYGPGFWLWAVSFPLLLLAWLPLRRPRLRAPALLDVAALLVVCLASVARFYRVADVPYSAHFDENTGVWVLLAMERGAVENMFGRIDHYSTNLPGLMMASQWLLGGWAPNWFTADRWTAALFGSLSLVTTYLLGRRLFSRPVALLAVVFLAVSHWHILLSRFQSLFATSPFAAALALWGLTRACQTGRVLDGIVAGLLLGFGLEMHDPVKVLFVVVPAWWLWSAVVERGFARRTLLSFGVAMTVAYMVLSPVLRNEGWANYLLRVQQVTMAGAEYRDSIRDTGGDWGELLRTRIARQGMILTGGAEVAANHHSDTPLLNGLELAAAVAGLGLCLFRLRDWRYALLPFWLLPTMVAVLLSSVPEASYRLAVALPAVAILAALSSVTTVRTLRSVLPRPAALVLCVLVATATLGYDVAVNWERTVRYFASMTHAHELQTLGREVAAGPAEAVYYVEGTPDILGNRVFRALTSRRSVVNVPNLAAQVPEIVDPRYLAVFVLPYWSAGHSLSLLQEMYPSGSARLVVDPSSIVAGQLFTVPAGALARNQPHPCGLERVCVGQGAVAVDPFVAFLSVDALCAGSNAIEWRGGLMIPDHPLELAVDSSGLRVTLSIDGETIEPLRGSRDVVPVCLLPGAHEFHMLVERTGGYPRTVLLGWQRPGQELEAVPCAALWPNAESQQGVTSFPRKSTAFW